MKDELSETELVQMEQQVAHVRGQRRSSVPADTYCTAVLDLLGEVRRLKIQLARARSRAGAPREEPDEGRTDDRRDPRPSPDGALPLG